MSEKPSVTNRLFVLNDIHAPRLCPELAVEIGLNESLIFLQLEYLIAIGGHERDGRRWTYQSVSDLQKMFPFWCDDTISRTIQRLKKRNLIVIGNYNQHQYDRTRWFAINLEEAAKLSSLQVVPRKSKEAEPLPQSQESIAANCGNATPQNRTTIPEITTETTKEILPIEKDQSAKPTALSPAGGEFFKQWHRKRWHTQAEKELFESTEKEVSSAVMLAAVQWGAVSGIANVKSICTRAKNMAREKKPDVLGSRPAPKEVLGSRPAPKGTLNGKGGAYV